MGDKKQSTFTFTFLVRTYQMISVSIIIHFLSKLSIQEEAEISVTSESFFYKAISK